MEIKYQLTPEYMATYQAAIRPRLTAMRKGWLASSAARAALFAALGFLVFFAGDWLAQWLMDTPLDAFSLMWGFGMGVLLIVCGTWIDYGEMRGAMLKPDGLMYSPHVLRVTDEGLNFGNAKYEGNYSWAAFDEVTRLKDIIVLWIEPGLGFVVPEAAFASAEEANAFFENARVKIAAANPA